MSFLILHGDRYALPIGETTLGGARDDVLAATSLAALPAFALVTVLPGELTTVRSLGTSVAVTLDGEPLGAEPREIRHGACIEAGGHRILYGDIRTVGSTGRVVGVTDDEVALLMRFAVTSPTAATGGRLTALRSAAVFSIPDEGLVIGRDPASSVALASKEVSRRHATVRPTLQGYVLTDESVNGVHVNGARVDGSLLLGQGDIVRVADEEFRFEADPASFEPAPTPRAEQTPPSPEVRSATPPAPRAALLASLEVVSRGVLNATIFRVERPAVQVGRGPHNDVCLPDDSVSGSHATLLRRDGAWYVFDLQSTNGTYVDGERITGEHALKGAAELRFGGIKMVFRPIAPAATDTNGTRGIVGVTGDALRKRVRS